ncbi:ATP-binding protein [Pseudomonas gingeri]|uniref:ATP-binding protein n=1 Tax=Pseudomonas gingeri TaxID=117681 RepID=UPI00159FCE89|nr:AAA family ATPase [Pseudomonas gingeri]NWD07452.1 AAA family ATPase [Pseudomonas gingeri]NWE35435.1 AAA family ATPase [Pseudomonas gingeri]NWE54764.1 AAA family ATPase [Pseudomonas gingeri]NWF01665.1 AAA family ATPase [Pseudomonas gingeri]
MDSRNPSLSAVARPGSAISDGRVLLDGGLLKGLRKQHGLSQETLAEACLNRHLCVSIASIKRAETGKPVLYRTARHLATAFEVDVSALLGQSVTAALEDIEQTLSELHDSVFSAQAADYAVIRYVLELCFATDLSPDNRASTSVLLFAEDIERLIRQFGGVPVDATSGLVIARFGSPQAYRSDSERALLCALALSREQLVRAGHGIALRLVRESRDVEALPAEALALIHHAFPVQHGNAPVHVAQNLVEQLSPRFEFAAGEAAFPAYRRCQRLRNLDENAPRPLVGRAIEVLQFKGVIEATEECQDGHVVYLRGMAGIGKTRLVSEFFEMARQGGFACHRGDVLDFGMDHGLWPLGQLVCSLLAPGTSPPISGQELEAAALRLKLSAEQLMFLQILTGVHPAGESFKAQLALYAAMSSEARTQGLFNALLQLLLRIAVQQPLLIAVEDLHWGDATLFAMLGKLLNATNEAPIVWLLTSRPEGDPLESQLRPHCANPMSLLDIAPIRAREAAVLAEQFPEIDPGYRADCVTRAQGNPLYLTQLLSNQEGVLPDSLRHLVQTRVDRFSPEQRRALHYAAVLGNRFDLALWREALGKPDYVPEAQWRQSLLREVEPGSYMFVHDLVMHCLYDAMPRVLREQLHRAVATLYHHRDRVLHAQHLLRADAPEAFDALLAAMLEKLQACQYDSVLALGLQAAGRGERAASSFDLALLRAQACSGLGRTSEARDSFQQALTLAARDEERIEAALGLAAVLNTLDCLDEEEHLIEQTLPVAQGLQAHTALARLYHLRGNIYFPRGDYVKCRRLHEESLSFARIGLHLETQAKALSGIGDSYYAQGSMQTAYEVFDQCVRLCERHELVQVEAGNRSARGSAQFYLGHSEAALRDATQAIESSRRIGNHRAEVFSRLTASWVLSAAGRDTEAGQELSDALELARNLGASRFEAILLEGLARVALRQGERGRAQGLIMEAAERVERFALQRYIGPWVYGSLALLLDDETLKRQALARGEALLDQACLAHNVLQFRVSAAEVCLLAGDIEQAINHGQQMAILPESASCAWIRHHVRLIGAAGQWLQSADRSNVELLHAIRREAEQLGFVATMPELAAVLPRSS